MGEGERRFGVVVDSTCGLMLSSLTVTTGCK